MELQQLIEQFSDSSGNEKTASEGPKGSSMQDTTTTAGLKDALSNVLESGQQKTASEQGNPVNDLMKLAEELSGVDKEAEEALARTLGMAFADSAHRRWSELNEKVGAVTPAPTADASVDSAVKVATLQGYQDATQILNQEKVAEDTDALVKEAAVQGYNDAQEAIANSDSSQEKMASSDALEMLVKQAEAGDQESQYYLQKISAEYEDGQEAALQTIHKVASEEFLKGAAETQILIQHMQAQQ
jgi:hypothetical protein